MRKRMTTDEFIVKAKIVHGDTYDYSQTIYTGTYNPIIVICHIHRDFNIKPTDHLDGSECKICKATKLKKARNMSQDEFVGKCEETHKGKYDYSKTIYVDDGSKIIINCPIHNEFSQRAGDHMRGHECKECSLLKNSNNRRMTFDEFVKKANKKHNGKYAYYEDNYIGTMSNDQITIYCPIHGDFEQIRNVHLQGSECKTCANNKPLTVEDVIRRSNEAHNGFYGYSSLIEISKDKSINIICPNHGLFAQNVNGHMSGHGCLDCAIEKNTEKKRWTLEKFVKEATKLHEGRYTYENAIYVRNNIKLLITCPDHGNFPQTPNNHLQDHGCPECTHHISKGEIKWLDSLNIHSLIRQHATWAGEHKYKADGFDPITNTIYEYNGDWWHGNPKKYKSDKRHYKAKKVYGELYVKTLCKELDLIQAGYNVISVWESDVKLSRRKK